MNDKNWKGQRMKVALDSQGVSQEALTSVLCFVWFRFRTFSLVCILCSPLGPPLHVGLLLIVSLCSDVVSFFWCLSLLCSCQWRPTENQLVAGFMYLCNTKRLFDNEKKTPALVFVSHSVTRISSFPDRTDIQTVLDESVNLSSAQRWNLLMWEAHET